MSTRVVVRLLVMAVGVAYVVLAISGFASISDDTNVGGGLRGGNDADLLWGLFSVNTVLNFIHFLFGALTLITGFVIDRTKLMGWTMTGAFVVLAAYDVIAMLVRTGTDPLAVNAADLWLHAITAALLLVVTIVVPTQPQHPRKPSRDRQPTSSPRLRHQ